MGITAAVVLTAGAATYNASESRNARKDQQAANAKAEKRAVEAQEELAALAVAEKETADMKIEEQRARMLKGKRGRSGLLFGNELGVQPAKTKTLGG